MRVVHLLIGAGILAIAGCATVSQMTATGGSRADGTVKLSFEQGIFDRVSIDQTAALETARRRCTTWGYADAEPFGGNTSQCQAWSSLGCTRKFVTVEYQCTSPGGSPTYANAAAPPGSMPMSPPMPMTNSPQGAVDLGGGVSLRPAHTLSGYCIAAAPGYQGTGSVNRPSVTSARPICN